MSLLENCNTTTRDNERDDIDVKILRNFESDNVKLVALEILQDSKSDTVRFDIWNSYFSNNDSSDNYLQLFYQLDNVHLTTIDTESATFKLDQNNIESVSKLEQNLVDFIKHHIPKYTSEQRVSFSRMVSGDKKNILKLPLHYTDYDSDYYIGTKNTSFDTLNKNLEVSKNAEKNLSCSVIVEVCAMIFDRKNGEITTDVRLRQIQSLNVIPKRIILSRCFINKDDFDTDSIIEDIDDIKDDLHNVNSVENTVDDNNSNDDIPTLQLQANPTENVDVDSDTDSDNDDDDDLPSLSDTD